MIEEILVEAKQKLKRMFSEKIANFVEEKKRTDFINNLDCFLIHECGNIKSETNCQLLEGELYCAIVNYGSIEEILEFYTGVNVEFTSVDQLLNCVENKIVKHLNKVNDAQCQKLISDLVKKVNTMIYKWVVDNADANTQIHLDHLINTGAVLREVHNLGEVIMSELKNDKKSLGVLSFDDLSNAVKSHSLDCNFHCSLFGTIELNGVSKSCLADIESIPSQILFLVGDGGVGKTTHLSKFQQDMAKNDNVLPIYIPLFNKVNDDTIEKRIVKMYPNINGKSLSEESLREIFCSCQDKRHIVILLDGLNEYKGNNTVLFDNINDLCSYPNISFIVTSRYPAAAHNIIVDRLDQVTEARIKHLCKDQVCEYLSIKSFPIHFDEKAVDLLTTPFYIKICKEIGIDICDYKSINASLLMYKYIQHNKTHLDEIGGKIIENVFPYICYICYKNDSSSECVEDITNLQFDANTIMSAVDYFNENNAAIQPIEPEDVENILISCNLIEKRESLGITQYYFKHQNIRDTYAAYHVAKTALRIANGMGNENPKFGSEIELHAELDDFNSEINNSINVLCNNNNYKIRYLSSNNLIVLQVRLKTSFSINEIVLNAQAFVKEYEKLSDNVCLKEALSEMYILALCILAKDFRLLRTGEPPLVSFEKCLLCAQKAKKVYDNDNRNNSDGYNHIGKCLNSFMEYILNCDEDVDIKADYSLIEKVVGEINFADYVLEGLKNDNSKINSGLQLVLGAAQNAYTLYCEMKECAEYKEKVLWILALNYVSRAYMVEACLKKSAESLNLVAMILENDYNIRLRDKIKEKYGVDVIELQTFGINRLEYSYTLYDRASKLPHIVRGYSAQKKAIMLITGKVKHTNSKKIDEIKNDLRLSDYAGLPMTYYWEGRFNNDIVKKPSDAVGLFEIEQKRIIDVGNLDNKVLSKVSMPLMLVKIELLPYYISDNNEKNSLNSLWNLVKGLNYDSLTEFHLPDDVIGEKLWDEISYIISCLKYQNDHLYRWITADKFWITEGTVKENIERFLNNFKVLVERMEINTHE